MASDTATAATNEAQATNARTFWGTAAAHQGTRADKDNMLVDTDINGNSFFECCDGATGFTTIATDSDYGQCPSAFLMTQSSGTPDYSTGTVPATNRIAFMKPSTASPLMDGSADPGTAFTSSAATFNVDFLLASQAQLNQDDDDSSVVGFCSGEFRRVMTTDSAITLETETDFNSNTKCTW